MTSAWFRNLSRTEVHSLEKHYWKEIRDDDKVLEMKFISGYLDPYRGRGLFDRNVFLEIYTWKMRTGRHFNTHLERAESNPEAKIVSITQSAFADNVDVKALEILQSLSGVGLASASALLYWMKPTTGVIVDQMVCTALWEDWDDNCQIDIERYRLIASEVRPTAQRLNCSLRTLDRALWLRGKRLRDR